MYNEHNVQKLTEYLKQNNNLFLTTDSELIKMRVVKNIHQTMETLSEFSEKISCNHCNEQIKTDKKLKPIHSCNNLVIYKMEIKCPECEGNLVNKFEIFGKCLSESCKNCNTGTCLYNKISKPR